MLEIELWFPQQWMREQWFETWKAMKEINEWPEFKNRNRMPEALTDEEYLRRLAILERDAKAEMKRKLQEIEKNFKAELAKYRKEKSRIKKKLKSSD